MYIAKLVKVTMSNEDKKKKIKKKNI